MENKTKDLSALFVPIAIVIGGIMVSAAIFLSQGKAQGTETDTNTDSSTTTTTVSTKNDKPVVELFVMSHCPYGTMAEKGIIPAVEALGDKIDFKVRFVYYAMHGEKEVKEQLNQYCIQKEQTDKYIPYLKAFLNDGDGTKALQIAGVDTTALATCAAAADAQFKVTENFNNKNSWLSGSYPLFDIDKDLNTKYDVGGSPTLVINGETVSSGRDSASYLAVICSAFNNKPEECNISLSSTTPSAGFGYGTSTSGSSGSCN